MLNLDTHILLHSLGGQLTTKERNLLLENTWGISAIVLWEITKLSQLHKIKLDVHSFEFIRVISKVHVWPIDLAVCQKIIGLDFRSDPADEIIAATSLLYNVPLLTRDKKILNSKLIKFP